MSAQHNVRSVNPWGRRLLIGLALLMTLVVIVLPLLAVFAQALSRGWEVYVQNITDPEALHAIKLTLLAAAIAVPVNTVFGVSAAWAITRFRFPGRRILQTFIDIPFSVSPVVAGVMYLMLYGSGGWIGGWLEQHDLQVMFTVTGIVLVTVFVTSPFVARELIPFMQAQGTEEEEAARVMGASGWQTFWRVTLPNIKWALIYGIILCNARAMGEFGAVAVVSGNIRGETNTLPLYVQQLFDEHNMAGAFAAASLLAGLAVLTLVLKSLAEWKQRRNLAKI
ncbi:sulfate ABC transporter permease subunit CysW [Alkalilimnicola ehrlichii]|uniref:Sulfate transport system permease protein CysW n=1 Tax=Alkalilimnicola ehrlichii TaxID=351052 RepID=A0A3E0X0K1_9GAMM|nr:sulfate ABC transporter permease subunit CysW [Alkalilimnicola ehrlichii]RFA30998.1 sulfate ABC transporter permease subunit CysW [Alkalilimnicola ehrlichii]RFA38950.1 sulfate ABC transporter permease subunit CysW [Alkalilimnicola ehrlichii]